MKTFFAILGVCAVLIVASFALLTYYAGQDHPKVTQVTAVGDSAAESAPEPEAVSWTEEDRAIIDEYFPDVRQGNSSVDNHDDDAIPSRESRGDVSEEEQGDDEASIIDRYFPDVRSSHSSSRGSPMIRRRACPPGMPNRHPMRQRRHAQPHIDIRIVRPAFAVQPAWSSGSGPYGHR